MERLEKTKKDVFFADNFSGGCLAADVFYMFFGLVRSPFRSREKQVFSTGEGLHFDLADKYNQLDLNCVLDFYYELEEKILII